MSTSENKAQNFWQRIWNSVSPSPFPIDDRGRMRMVMDSLVLHLHPAKVPARTLSWTYTWGLGGLSALLIMLLAVTGVFLQMNYTPAPPQAYLDILALRSDTWFGDLLRNLHHWSANLLVLVVILHLLRVFLTGSFRPPRENNWIFGILMLLLVLAANFTGYLLPWDQLAFWAITVGTSILSYIPLVGEWISRTLLGGPEVGPATLLKFYSLHISWIPLALVMLMSVHFWRVRKDGGLTIPRQDTEEQEPKIERVTTIPNLVRREMIFAVSWIAILLIWSIFIPAPLEEIANPAVSPNPAKAPWYFMGLQELLLHFHPLVGAILIPILAFGALIFMPFYDINLSSVGVYFRSSRGKALGILATGLSILLTPLWVFADEFLLDWSGWLAGWPSLVANGVVPLAFIGLGLLVLEELVHKTYHTSQEERILFTFLFLFTAFVILTIIGIFFRGPGMALMWPWELGSTIH